MKKIIFLIIACFVFSVVTVIVLFALSDRMKDEPNSFLRLFPPHPVIMGDTLNLKSHSYYIAGGTRHTVYLGNYTVPLRLLIVNMNMNALDMRHVRLKINGVGSQKFWSATVQVDSPYYYLTDGAVPIMYKGNMQDWKAEKYLYDSIYFQTIAHMRGGSFAVKSLSGATGENVLGKITAWAPYQHFTDRILQKQVDGVFCTNGMMYFNKVLNQLVYLYYYRNQFMVIDTSMNLLYRGNTIDTTSYVKIKVGTIESGQTKILSSPPYFVNRLSTTSGDWLFVNSNLLAKNEYVDAFETADVIDMYNLRNGKYAFSFYIYHLQGKNKMSEFRVFDDTMMVRWDNVIGIYTLKPEYFASPLPSGVEGK
ncbi:MAG: hypothetical protein JST48_10920 [Bacteroidetes bacterium]|nr:hypothetical protein [Bacteroidota bacterium]